MARRRFTVDREQSLLVARALLRADPYVYWNPMDGPEREWTILEACQLVRGLSDSAFAQVWRDYAAGGDRRDFAAALLKHFKRSWGTLNSEAIEEAARGVPDDIKCGERVGRLAALARWAKRGGTAQEQDALFRFARQLDGQWVRVGGGKEVSGTTLMGNWGLCGLVVRHPHRAEEIARIVRDRGIADPAEVGRLLEAASVVTLAVGAL